MRITFTKVRTALLALGIGLWFNHVNAQICSATNTTGCSLDWFSGVILKNAAGTTATYSGLNCNNTGPSNKLMTNGAQGTVNYTWIIENGGKQNAAAVQHNFVKDGVYTVTMYAVTKSTGCECSITKKVVMDRAGANDFISSGVSLFPNPSEGKYHVLLSENFGKVVTIEMRSNTGAVVKIMQVDNTGIIPVDASGLSNGMYYVRISSGENTAVRKLNISQ